MGSDTPAPTNAQRVGEVFHVEQVQTNINFQVMANIERISTDTFRELQEVIALAQAQINAMGHNAHDILFSAWGLADGQREALQQTIDTANELQRRLNAFKSRIENITDWGE